MSKARRSRFTGASLPLHWRRRLERQDEPEGVAQLFDLARGDGPGRSGCRDTPTGGLLNCDDGACSINTGPT